jgi:asparagine synthase (glutamine-hydrolysing)
MCGISLVVGESPADGANLAALEVLHRDQAHRGPDGEGWLGIRADGTVCRSPSLARWNREGPAPWLAAAFRRLAIRDLDDRAAQPLARRSDSLWILCNGELYNDAEIRRDLGAMGVRFATESDAETMLAAYEAWGPACVERLRGMWAAVIVDIPRRRLILTRDRLGIKPLVYAVESRRLIVASEPRALARVAAGGPRVDIVRWRRFLQGLPAAAPDHSFFAGVTPLPAGSWATFDLMQPADPPQLRSYWSLAECLPDPGDRRSHADCAAALRDLLEESVTDHLVGDRPVGCSLSGGLDSSIVATLFGRAGLSRSGACSVVYDDPRMSEWPYVRAAAAHAGLTPAMHSLTPEEAWTLVDGVVTAQAEPLLGQDALAHYRVFQMAREAGFAVMLDGQGADELFAGLPSYELVMFREWLRTGRWRRVQTEAALRARAVGRTASWGWRRYVLGALRTWRPASYPWLSEPRGPSPGADPPPADASRDPSLLNRFLFNLVRRTNMPAVLQIQDRNAMAHGVENRPPFLDHRIVEWAFRLPAEQKVGDGRRKRVVWSVGSQLLPSLILGRTDKRAIVSRSDWMPLRTGQREPLMALAANPRLRQAPCVDGPRLTTFIRDYLDGRHDDSSAIWRLYTASRWLELFQPTA